MSSLTQTDKIKIWARGIWRIAKLRSPNLPEGHFRPNFKTLCTKQQVFDYAFVVNYGTGTTAVSVDITIKLTPQSSFVHFHVA